MNYEEMKSILEKIPGYVGYMHSDTPCSEKIISLSWIFWISPTQASKPQKEYYSIVFGFIPFLKFFVQSTGV